MLLLIHAVVIRGLKIVLIGHNECHYDIDKNPRESRSEERESSTKSSLTTVTSMWRYSARPAQTPQIFFSLVFL